MKTTFARALLALTLVTLPASALASTKADKAKHSHSHSTVTQKEHQTKKTKHHGHKSTESNGVAARTSAPSGPGAARTPSARSKRGTDASAVASHRAQKDKAPVASKSVPAEPLVH